MKHRAKAEAMQVHEIADPETLVRLRPEWREIATASPTCSPFQTPEWLIAWREAFLPKGLLALTVRDGRRLAGLAAFYVHPCADGGRQLTLLGNGLSDRLDLIARPEDAAEVAAAVFDHLGRSEAWDSCDFRDVAAGSPLLTTPFAGAQLDLVEAETPCPTLDLRDPEAELPERRRRDLERCARRLEEHGRVDHRTSEGARRSGDLSDLIRLHGARWAGRGEDGVFGEAAVERFHEAVTDALLSAGSLRLDVLTLDGRTIAAHYGFRHGGQAYSYAHGFEASLAACSPSRLLLDRVIAEARRDGLSAFDFLRGQEPYKYEWGARDRPQFRRRIVR